TVEMIARRAGLTTGVIYRRFKDKDALFRHVFEAFLEELEERNHQALREQGVANADLQGLVQGVVAGMVAQYRSQSRFLGALLRYSENSADASFRRRCSKATQASFD